MPASTHGAALLTDCVAGMSSANHVVSYRFDHAVSPSALNHHTAQSNHGKMSAILLNLEGVQKTGQLHLRYDAARGVKRDSMAYVSGLRTVDQAVTCAREIALIANAHRYDAHTP